MLVIVWHVCPVVVNPIFLRACPRLLTTAVVVAYNNQALGAVAIFAWPAARVTFPERLWHRKRKGLVRAGAHEKRKRACFFLPGVVAAGSVLIEFRRPRRPFSENFVWGARSGYFVTRIGSLWARRDRGCYWPRAGGE